MSQLESKSHILFGKGLYQFGLFMTSDQYFLAYEQLGRSGMHHIVDLHK